jgi:hypothetical protein
MVVKKAKKFTRLPQDKKNDALLKYAISNSVHHSFNKGGKLPLAFQSFGNSTIEES